MGRAKDARLSLRVNSDVKRRIVRYAKENNIEGGVSGLVEVFFVRVLERQKTEAPEEQNAN